MVIQVPSGEQIRVPAKHLELVAPDLLLRPAPDGQLADWWLDVLDGWDQPLRIASFVPREFQAVCRILHPWADRQGRPVIWHEVVDWSEVPDRQALAQRLAATRFGSAARAWNPQLDEPREGELDQQIAASLVDLLAEATSTPDDVLFAVWVGWGDVPPQRFPGAARLDTHARGHFLLRGPLHGALTSITASRVGARPVSGIWWPADRAWFVHTEIDFPWTFLAGNAELIEEAQRRTDLETIRTTFNAPANQVEHDLSTTIGSRLMVLWAHGAPTACALWAVSRIARPAHTTASVRL